MLYDAKMNTNQPIKLSNLLLATLLFAAALIHFYHPASFTPAIPDFFLYKTLIVIITGIIEVILAFGLLIKKYKHLAASLTTFYFILLVPVHVYVAFNGIELFGISNKLLLWLRTFFQYAFILWAYSLQKNRWVIEQTWRHVFFIHYKIDPVLIEKKVPFKLDLFEGSAVISVVPFKMDGIRFPFLPPVPVLSSLNELNLRTYVEVDGIKGIYFFTLETDSLPSELIAKKFFYLPYRFSKIFARIKDGHYTFQHERWPYSLYLRAQIMEKSSATSFDRWATERYSLFTKHGNTTYQGIVRHSPWKLREVKIDFYENQFTKMLLPESLEIYQCNYSEYLKVRFIPFRKLGEVEN